MHKSLVCVFVAAGMLQGCSTLSQSQSAPELGPGYVSSETSESVTTASGDCLKAMSISSDNMIVECQASAKAPEPMTQIMALSFDGTALFDFDSSELSAAGRSELDALVSKVDGNTDVGMIKVVGHADSMGPTDYNQVLSEARAQSVQQYLQDALSDVNIVTTGMGELDPVADNATETGRQRNRRVDIQVNAKVEKAIFQ